MAKNYFKRYIWLIDVIGRYGHITRREINDLWSRSSINEYREKEIPERTFHNHIAPTFDFKQEIISKMDDVEVLSPESFRKEIKDTVARMAKLYEE